MFLHYTKYIDLSKKYIHFMSLNTGQEKTLLSAINFHFERIKKACRDKPEVATRAIGHAVFNAEITAEQQSTEFSTIADSIARLRAILAHPQPLSLTTVKGSAARDDVVKFIKLRADTVISEMVAKTLAKFISDGRSGDPEHKKEVATTQAIKLRIELEVSNYMHALRQTETPASRAFITLKLLEKTFEVIYKGDKQRTFTRKNDSYFLPSFFKPNTTTSKETRSGTEQKHIKLLKKIYLVNLRQLKRLNPNINGLQKLAHSNLLQFHLSYYKVFATGETRSTRKARRIVSPPRKRRF